LELWVDATNAPYVVTKPLHNSQRLIKQNEDGSIIIHLFIIPNFELERILLGFGNGLEVIRPETFRARMRGIIQRAFERYEDSSTSEKLI
jgi:predicted DNA-binding transcriptional regulator YafY